MLNATVTAYLRLIIPVPLVVEKIETCVYVPAPLCAVPTPLPLRRNRGAPDSRSERDPTRTGWYRVEEQRHIARGVDA